MSEHTRERFEDLTDDEAVRWLWRRGRVTATVGASIGLGVCLVFGVGLVALLTLLLGTRSGHLAASDVVPLIIRAAGLIALGAAIGLTITGITFSNRLTAVLGRGPQSKKIRRVVFRNDGTPLTPEEQARAARYAPLGAASMRFQFLSLGILYVGILLQQVASLLQSPTGSGIDLRPLAAITAILLLAVYAVLLPLQIRNTIRARRYAAAHAHLVGPS